MSSIALISKRGHHGETGHHPHYGSVNAGSTMASASKDGKEEAAFDKMGVKDVYLSAWSGLACARNVLQGCGDANARKGAGSICNNSENEGGS